MTQPIKSINDLIDRHKIIVCAGSGGVGKTTLSAALGILAAERGKKVLVLTIDPAKRLATALGLEGIGSGEVRVSLPGTKGELYAAVVDSKAVFDEFVFSQLESEEEKAKIINNRLYHQLSTTLSGSQEYTALERLHRAAVSGLYDLVILDTPPAQHAVDFLRAPQRLFSLFQSSVIQWFLPAEHRPKGFMGMIDRGTKKVIASLEVLTGAAFLEELREFFMVIRSLKGPIQDHSASIHSLLTGAQTTFVVVTSFDELKIQEARLFRRQLLATGYGLSMVIINRAFPEWLHEKVQFEGEAPSSTQKKLRDFYERLVTYHRRHEVAFRGFENELKEDLAVLRIPDFNQDIYEVAGLKIVADELARCGNREARS